MPLGLRYIKERGGDGAGQPLLDVENGEELMHVQPEVGIVLGDRTARSPGTLYITNKRLVWLDDVDAANGYAVDFLSVSLHAISRDPASYPHPCIYAQIETEILDYEDEELENSEAECNGNLELSRVNEMRLLPSDPSQLDTLFEIFCDCAELNPDPNEEQEEEDTWIFGAEMRDNGFETGEDPEWHPSDLVNSIGHANGLSNHDLGQRILELQIDDCRFEDADEMKNEDHEL